jgi:secondary thiamine-phosphate synthase enzyme
MRTAISHIELASTQPIEIIDITARVRESVQAHGLKNGMVTLLSQHTTARVNLNENEARLREDMISFLQRVAPPDAGYGHDIAPVDDRKNAHSHLLGLFANASECIPVQNGELLLGEWQALFFLELDGPRPKRRVLVQILGV